MIWNPKIEMASRDEIRTLQLERLQRTVAMVYEQVPFYRAKLDERGVRPEHIRTLRDIELLPFTEKDDLRTNYPYGLFAVPLKDVVRIHASSGTTGKPTVVGYTKNDLEMWAEAMARLIAAAGGSDEEIAQVAFGYSLFTGAFGLHYGLEKVGATVVPISSGNTERQINLMRDFGSTMLISTPSYAMYMAEIAEKMGIDAKTLPLKYGLFGGEGSTEEMRTQLQDRLGIIATENYGLSEIIGPGVSGECLERHGMHLNEDLFYPEIVDPDTGETLPEGEYGELVLTPIAKEALTLLRYRTHDITRMITEPCACGRTSYRMEKVRGRSDDMLIIRGVNVFPSQIESVLLGINGIGPHYEIIVRRENYLDKIEVVCELVDASLLELFSGLERLTREIQSKLRVVLQIDADIRLASPGTLKRFEGKAKRVTDLRNA